MLLTCLQLLLLSLKTLSSGVEHLEVEHHGVEVAEPPLKFEDIVNTETYDKMRPPKPGGQAAKVLFHVTVMSLDSIDEGSMTYAADIFFGQEWNDHRLRLPENMTRDYQLLPIEWLNKIWRPDSYFKNAKRVTFQTMTIPNHYVWLYRTKKIFYMVKLTLLLSCSMKFALYPHDEQNCHMAMESLSHTTDDLVFEWFPLEDQPLVVEALQLPQLELIRNTTEDCTASYSTGNFTCLKVEFKFRRRLGYFMFHTYIPTCLIVMMSWISFWIKPEAVPARVTLGVTSLLTLSTQHANSQKSLPPVSYIKAIDMFMSSCTLFVFFSLIEYAFVNVMMGDISEIERKDKQANSKLRLRSIISIGQNKLARQTTFCVNKEPPEGDFLHLEAAPPPPAAPLGPHHHQLHYHTQHGQHPGTGSHHSSHSNLQTTELQAGASMCPKHGNHQASGPAAVKQLKNGNGSRAQVDTPAKAKPKEGAMDTKEVMKRRREKAICIDRVSRILFPCTFVLLNIMYWLAFSDILESINESME